QGATNFNWPAGAVALAASVTRLCRMTLPLTAKHLLRRSGPTPKPRGTQHSRIRARAAAQASGYLFDLNTFCNGPRPPRLVLDEAAPRRDPVDGILTSSSGRSFP